MRPNALPTRFAAMAVGFAGVALGVYLWAGASYFGRGWLSLIGIALVLAGLALAAYAFVGSRPGSFLVAYASAWAVVLALGYAGVWP
jgi:hypothetical protein